MKRGVAGLVGVVVAVGLVAGCGASGGRTESEPKPSTASDSAMRSSALSSELSAAMEVVDADARWVEFTDARQIKERQGVEQVTSASPESEQIDSAAKLRESPIRLGQLWTVAPTMGQWGWNAWDIEWYVEYIPAARESGRVAVWKLRDDVDFAAVRAGLEKNGYTADGDAYTGELGSDNPAVSAVGGAVRLDEPRHLITSRLIGEAPGFVAAADSLARSGQGDQVLAGVGSPELLRLGLGADACRAPTTRLQLDDTPIAEFGQLQAMRFAMADDTTATARSWYANQATAQANLAPHVELIEGESPFTQRPYADFGDFEVKLFGRALDWTFTAAGGGLASQFDQTEGPWGLCGPQSVH